MNILIREGKGLPGTVRTRVSEEVDLYIYREKDIKINMMYITVIMLMFLIVMIFISNIYYTPLTSHLFYLCNHSFILSLQHKIRSSISCPIPIIYPNT